MKILEGLAMIALAGLAGVSALRTAFKSEQKLREDPHNNKLIEDYGLIGTRVFFAFIGILIMGVGFWLAYGALFVPQ